MVIVVGAGVVGLLTALSVAIAGRPVTVLDRGPIPNPASSSYARQRILRSLHPGSPSLTRRAVLAERRWRRIERQLGETFYHRVGALTVLPQERVRPAHRLLRRAGGRGEALTRLEMSRRWPHIRFQAGSGGVLEEDAGVILADRALKALARWLGERPGVRLCPRHEVKAIDADTGVVVLRAGGSMRAQRIVLAAGAWSHSLIPDSHRAGLELFRQTVLLCCVPAPMRDAWRQTPAITALSVPYDTWLVPPVAGTPLKLTAASACRAVPRMAGVQAPVSLRQHLIRRFSPSLPGFAPSWIRTGRDCYYLADAASGGERRARIGSRGAVRAHLACGGRSFKFAPLIARWLAGGAR
jgi:glycine/D-amino acid oxidase-like deaminating enzyme